MNAWDQVGNTYHSKLHHPQMDALSRMKLKIIFLGDTLPQESSLRSVLIRFILFWLPPARKSSSIWKEIFNSEIVDEAFLGTNNELSVSHCVHTEFDDFHHVSFRIKGKKMAWFECTFLYHIMYSTKIRHIIYKSLYIVL